MKNSANPSWKKRINNLPQTFTLVIVIVPILAAFALGFAPLNPSLRHWGETNRTKMLWGVFVSAWFLSWIAAAGLFARLLYSIASFYFDTTFGQVADVTRATVQAHAWSVLVEIWLRQLLGWIAPSTCFSASGLTCQLAAGAARLGSLGIPPAIVALFPALLSLLIARWIAARRSRRNAATDEKGV